MGSFKLGGMTLGSLFKKPETVLYPTESKPKPLGLKGHVAIEASDCILCGICQKNCPCDAIEVDKKERVWVIDSYCCVQCGNCVRSCPKSCLHMDSDFPIASSVMSKTTVSVPEQAKVSKTAE